MPQSENPTELKDELRQIKGGIALSTEGFSSHRQRLFARFPSSSTKHTDEWERRESACGVGARGPSGSAGRAGRAACGSYALSSDYINHPRYNLPF